MIHATHQNKSYLSLLNFPYRGNPFKSNDSYVLLFRAAAGMRSQESDAVF